MNRRVHVADRVFALTEGPVPEVRVGGERGAFLDLLVARAAWVAEMGRVLVGFPPEVIALATQRAAESGDGWALLRAIEAIYDLERARLLAAGPTLNPGGQWNAVSLGIGQLLGMDPRDPNMRIWAGERVQDVFGL